jgi:hypothetical protein
MQQTNSVAESPTELIDVPDNAASTVVRVFFTSPEDDAIASIAGAVTWLSEKSYKMSEKCSNSAASKSLWTLLRITQICLMCRHRS